MSKNEAIDKMPGACFAPEQFVWLNEIRKAGKSERTRDCYARDLRDVGAVLTEINGRVSRTSDLAAIGQAEIDLIEKRWLTDGASLQTILRRFAALRGFPARAQFINSCDDATMPVICPTRLGKNSAFLRVGVRFGL